MNENMNKNMNENNFEENDSNLSFKTKIMNFYNKNKKELWLLLGLLIVFNFICPSKTMLLKNGGGNVPAATQIAEKGSNLKKFNLLSGGLSFMLSLVKSFITFCGLIIVIAVLPGLPVFIFMLILFFILRARMAAIKSY